MLHLHFAPSLDLLVPHLLRQLRSVWSDPFAPPTILIPNPPTGKWLQMRLADGNFPGNNQTPPLGCVANLPMPTIERFLWNLLDPRSCTMLHQKHIAQVLCALLDESCINQPEFVSVKKYLWNGESIDPLKRIQLATRIAHQFLEYEYNRPGVHRPTGKWQPLGIDGTWMNGRRYLPDNNSESWQAELYRRMRSCFASQQEPDAPCCLTLPQLYRRKREAVQPVNASLPIRSTDIFIFGVTNISHFHRNLLVEISQIDGVSMHLYLTNPCAEFWEDVDTSRGNLRRHWKSTQMAAAITPRQSDDYGKEELRDLTTSSLPTDQKLLELWGNAGKENIFLWCQDAAWNFEYHTPEWVEEQSTPPTRLKALQYALLRRENTLPTPQIDPEDDVSLQILACPDRGREIEEVREQILDMVENGDISLLNEVVVYLTDPKKYIPYIQRVFGCYAPNDPEHIPFCILGTSGSETLFSRGISVFCDILHKRFDRAAIFEFLRNPIVQASREIPAETVTVWEQWASELGMFRGYNRHHRKEMGDTGYTITDAHTFEHGIARMLLAELSEGTVELDFKEGGECEKPLISEGLPVIPYRDFTTSDRTDLELFCATIEALYLDGKRLRGAVSIGIEEALETIRELTHAWMGTIPASTAHDIAAEGTVQRSFNDSLSAIGLQKTVAGRSTIPPDEFLALVKGAIPQEGISRSSAWTGGITFAPLKPSMIIPHTIVFAAGLDDVLFPGSNERPSWDLLSARRIIGDSDCVRDNRFAFLELVHAARKRLILSYRADDMQKEEELHPSSVIPELASFLHSASTTNGSPVKFFHKIPWIVHESLAGNHRKHGSWYPVEHDLAQLAPKPRVSHRYKLSSLKKSSPAATGSLNVNLFDLKTFFRNPLEYHLQHTLGLQTDETASESGATDEPLNSDQRIYAHLQNRIWITVLRMLFTEDPGKALETYTELSSSAYDETRRLYSLHRASGNAPEAMIGQLEKESLLRWAPLCIEPALKLKTHFPDHRLIEKCDQSLQRQGVPGSLSVALNNGDTGNIACRHSLALIPRDTLPLTSVAIIALKTTGAITENSDLWLETTLQWLAESRNDSPASLFAVQLNRGNIKDKPADVHIASLKCSDPDNPPYKKFETWLSGLITQMIIERHNEHLPFSVIQKVWPTLSISTLAALLDSDPGAFVSYLPAFKLVDAQLPDLSDDDLTKLVFSRYAPLLESWLVFRKVTV